MNKKGLLLFIALLFSALIVTACGSDEEGEAEEEVSAAEEDEAVEEDEADEEEPEEEPEEEIEEEIEEEEETDETKEDTTVETDFSELITFMEEETEGTTNVLFENNKAQTHEMEGVSLTLEAYTLVELLDFHRDYAIPFDDQNNGAVILAQYTVKNDTENDAYYMPSLYMSYVGGDSYINNNPNLLPEEQQLSTLLSHNNDYLLEAGQEITAYYAYPIGEDRLVDVLAAGSTDVVVPRPHSEQGDVTSNFGSEGRFTLPLDEESAEKAEEVASQGFYEDKITTDNMGEKEMLESEEGIGESKDVGEATLTLEGYQFTNFVPNADEAPRFEADEVVLLTVKFMIDNGYDEALSKNTISSTLHVNDGKQWGLNEGMLLPYTYDDVIAAGETGELLQIYLLDQEQYEKIWKDKSFVMEIGPMYNEDAKDISKGEKAEFQLK